MKVRNRTKKNKSVPKMPTGFIWLACRVSRLRTTINIDIPTRRSLNGTLFWEDRDTVVTFVALWNSVL